MWSGPRNLSTAMMYSFGNRPDFDVIDEPFYAAYLNKTGIVHPMRDEIIASQQIDPECVINDLLNKKYDGGFHRYQKHMTQHMLKDFDLTWMKKVINVFLIRHPARVIKSFGEKLNNATIEDIGFKQQLNLFNYVSKIGQKPIVIDSFDIRKDPRSALECLCLEVGLEFMSEMLSWPKGAVIGMGLFICRKVFLVKRLICQFLTWSKTKFQEMHYHFIVLLRNINSSFEII